MSGLTAGMRKGSSSTEDVTPALLRNQMRVNSADYNFGDGWPHQIILEKNIGVVGP